MQQLTFREKEILLEVLEGHSDAEIAQHEYILTRTVNSHLSNIYRKLKTNRRQLLKISNDLLGDFDELTPAQNKYLHAAVAGMTNKEIAEVMNVSPRTVESMLRKAYIKLNVANRFELMLRLREESDVS